MQFASLELCFSELSFSPGNFVIILYRNNFYFYFFGGGGGISSFFKVIYLIGRCLKKFDAQVNCLLRAG